MLRRMLAAIGMGPASSWSRRWVLFALAAGGAAAATVALLLWLRFDFGGHQVTVAVDDIGEAVAALIAAVSCVLAGRRSQGRLRLAWTLLGISAASWGLGEVVWSVYEVGLGISVPFPSAADIGYLGAIPFAVAGILAFSHTPRGTSTGLRLWLDRAIVALSLLFVGWGLGLSQVYFSSGSTLATRLLGLAYPVGDILIGTVLVLAIRRATQEQFGRFWLLLGGLAANSLADSAFAYLTANGLYGSGNYIDLGWFVGYLMVALAAIWPATPADQTVEEEPIDLWQLALPWFAVLAAGLTALVRALSGHPMDSTLTLMAGGLAVLLFVSQTLAHRESLGLLIQSRLIASTLNDIVVHAPLGIIRLTPDLKIIQANPRAASLLATRKADSGDASIDEHFSVEESTRIREELLALTKSPGSTEFDTEVRQPDGSSLYLHWSVTVVRREDRRIDYFIAMIEDVSARRNAEAAAMANLAVLERLNRVKTDFLTRVSHEFRTALVGIQGFSELMRDTEQLDVKDVKTFADDIYHDARRLDASLNEMLTLDHAETVRLGLHVSPVDLNALVTSVIATMRPQASGHLLQAELDPAAPTVAGDETKLAQLLTLLVNNAVGRAPNGGRVCVTTKQDGQAVEVTVSDDGLWTADDVEENPGRRQTRGSAGGSMTGIGSDVGRSIARQIAEMHGGRIWYDRRSDAGGSSHFTLPSLRVSSPT